MLGYGNLVAGSNSNFSLLRTLADAEASSWKRISKEWWWKITPEDKYLTMNYTMVVSISYTDKFKRIKRYDLANKLQVKAAEMKLLIK